LPVVAQYRVASHLGLATVLLMFGLMVLGSIVRTTGSGLACPDWPLCQGRLIPPFEFHVMIEWSHRLAALLVSLLLVASVIWTLAHGALRARLGGLALLSLALLATQILLGALTVWKLLDPSVVGGHLGVALLLFSNVLLFTLVAQSHADPEAQAPTRPPGLLPWLGFTTVAAYVQCLLGGVVSAHHAGLACPDWPTCHGQWLPPLEGAIGLQMIHRYGAYTLTALVIACAWRSRHVPDPMARAGAAMSLGLTLAQVVLGVCSVLLVTPPWLVAAHLATAATILAMLVTTTFRVATLPGRERVLVPSVAR
jgi:cytochrome c oxidase assembly protein subunit 15